eukprot:gnl/Trimastix_PCT/1165.p1 GENE.gnl/Trimastix_PCT/1165~~gnl/Trimastix_PCT/1165.p1  ORF type:complete len:492 (-),score=154.95 gnl/Trimastix_PCT/1165:31-1506(-)
MEISFEGGGAYPEIHVPQHPLGMGHPKNRGDVALRLNKDGEIDYTSVLGARKDVTVYMHAKDAMVVGQGEQDLARPDEDEIRKTTDATRAALEKITQGKLQASQPSAPVAKPDAPQFIKYTPSQQQAAFNPAIKQRVIRMVSMPVDPLEPPKFKAGKAPRAPPSPPAPVLHSPPRKVTPQEQAQWKIPPCISNWKNPRGYTIPLDKRLAADGRSLQDVHINDNFAKLTESLYLAERIAREEIEKRNAMQNMILQKKNQAKEEQLRQMAQQARLGRMAGIPQPPAAATGANTAPLAKSAASAMPQTAPSAAPVDTDPLAMAGKAERDILREERRRDRDRERRRGRHAEEESRDGDKRPRLGRTRERDISEKIALGQGAGVSQDSMYDQRLFNQQEGLSHGFGSDEDYQVFSKPLLNGSSTARLYRPSREGDPSGHGRPIAFEKDPDEADPFGLESLMQEARRGGDKQGSSSRGSHATSRKYDSGPSFGRRRQ